jgi:hypothetical protein
MRAFRSACNISESLDGDSGGIENWLRVTDGNVFHKVMHYALHDLPALWDKVCSYSISISIYLFLFLIIL